jgi:GH24 family phage-related lysozyme (muramidase)
MKNILTCTKGYGHTWKGHKHKWKGSKHAKHECEHERKGKKGMSRYENDTKFCERALTCMKRI